MTLAPGSESGLSSAVPAPRQPLPLTEPSLPTAIRVPHHTRFTIDVAPGASMQARALGATLLRTLFFKGDPDPGIEHSIRQVLTCLAELTAVAADRSYGPELVCQLWRDGDHIFAAVEHTEPPANTSVNTGLILTKTIADEYGTHFLPGGVQTWAAVRINRTHRRVPQQGETR